ncbi:hypothetical protein LCP963914a_9837 [Penicillium roqueforti]|nr:hypothetical protein LCP963914a_9837 [Penicillium roqueforti]
MAATKVLLIPELLEEILLDLDMTTLLVSAQRVNRLWFDVISQSKRLQQALFFTPINPALKPSLAYSKPKTSPLRGHSPYHKEIVSTLNPLLEKHFGPVFFSSGNSPCILNKNNFSKSLEWGPDYRDEDGMPSKTLSRHKAFTRAGASWRRIRLQNVYEYIIRKSRCSSPPSSACSASSASSVSSLSSSSSASSTDSSESLPLSETGLRFGSLYDLVQDQTSATLNLGFYVGWGNYIPVGTEVASLSEEILKETSVVVQFFPDVRSEGGDLADVKTWDNTFRSEDFQLPDSELVDKAVFEYGL